MLCGTPPQVLASLQSLALTGPMMTSGDPSEPSGGGNFGAAAALRAKLQGRAAPAPKKETVVLPQVDVSGRAMPGAFGREAVSAGQLPHS